ncbi:MAG: DegT/DnrJ/EryC1/StrS family aminotransferase [Flavobacteriaceae bacterium]|nr:DegT/DnrJ/EryC1/StrS family aminotransferase [Flavobacteriaceae bacterium]
MIPFFNIKAENAPYAKKFTEELSLFLESGQYILGDAVTNFERQFAAFCGTDYCVGTSNGLDALRLIFEGYKSLGLIAEGDEVLVAAHTYIASVLAVVQANLTPVFVEPEDGSFGMDINEAQRLTSSKVKACLVVHLYGELVDVEAFQNFAQQHNLLLIEDAAQAHGAVNQKGIKAGALGDAAAFSFYPTKNIGALGDAGAVTTHDHNLERIIRQLQNYGSTKKNQHDLLGFNMRLDSLQARFLSSKLEVYPNQLKRRQEIAKRYLNEVNNPKLSLPKYLGDGSHVFHLFVVRVKDRKQFTNFLTRHNIGSLIHYPIPPHKQKSLKDFNNLSLPITELYHKEVVSIPLYPSLADEKITSIIEILNTY